MKEIWKEIIGYETFYEVSTFGNVRRIGKTKLLYPNKNKVILCKFGSSKAFNIAKLVAITFIPNPENKTRLKRINGLKDDNRMQNLEWI